MFTKWLILPIFHTWIRVPKEKISDSTIELYHQKQVNREENNFDPPKCCLNKWNQLFRFHYKITQCQIYEYGIRVSLNATLNLVQVVHLLC